MFAALMLPTVFCSPVIAEDTVVRDGAVPEQSSQETGSTKDTLKATFSPYTPFEGTAPARPLMASAADLSSAALASPGESSSSAVPEAFIASAIVVAPKEKKPGRNSDGMMHPFSVFALGFTSGTLGAGLEIASPVTRTINVRGGANFFSLKYAFSLDGADYGSQVDLRSGQFSVDWFPFHGRFRISPGVVMMKNNLGASASVPAGQAFLLGDDTFISSATDPVHGGATITFARSVMPSLTVGFGNLIPREGQRWSFPFEIGAAYMGQAAVNLNLGGSACLQVGCMSTSDPTIQSSVISEQNDLNETMKKLEIYPIVRMGVGFRF